MANKLARDDGHGQKKLALNDLSRNCVSNHGDLPRNVEPLAIRNTLVSNDRSWCMVVTLKKNAGCWF